MRFLFICKASSEIGFGHLIRSRTLAVKFKNYEPTVQIEYIAIGDHNIPRLIDSLPFPTQVLHDESELTTVNAQDIVFWDMIEVGDQMLYVVSKKAKMQISLSPVFNRMAKMDLFFHRTKYFNPANGQNANEEFLGLKYAFVQENCSKISAGLYEDNLDAQHFPIAISMGGGDAANKTLMFLRSLKQCQVPATFWVMLGEGYQHSYNELIAEIKKDTDHEIILAKTNKSMWQILKNCVLAILPGGITSYEAAYAGLPSIMLLESIDQEYLIKELVEENACISLGEVNESKLKMLNTEIERLYQNRAELLEMHIKSKALIDDNGAKRILDQTLHSYEAIVSNKQLI